MFIRKVLFTATFCAITAGSGLHADDTFNNTALQIIPRSRISGAGYDYFRIGNPADVQTKTSYGIVVAGGGRDVDAAMKWMIDRSGGGDFVVIRCSDDDAYNDYLYSLGKLNSVSTILINDKSGANSPFVADKVAAAEALFIAGGNQADYLNRWSGTKLQEAVQSLIARGVPVGGTSAGAAVLGELIYSAKEGSIYPDEIMSDPYNFRATFDRDLFKIPCLNGVITDTHFVVRDRMGRLAGFLARMYQDRWAMSPRGIGVDAGTALLIDSSGGAIVTGNGAAYFLSHTEPPLSCKPGAPLTYENIKVSRAVSGEMFNICAWNGNNSVPDYAISVIDGKLLPGNPYN